MTPEERIEQIEESIHQLCKEKNARSVLLESQLAAAYKRAEAASARHISVTYGELYGAYPEVANEIPSHEWDNKNTVEQQEWLLMQLRKERERAEAAERNANRRRQFIDECRQLIGTQDGLQPAIEQMIQRQGVLSGEVNRLRTQLAEAEAARNDALKQAAEVMAERDELKYRLQAWNDINAEAALAGTPAPCPVCGSEERDHQGLLRCECPCPSTLETRRRIAKEIQGTPASAMQIIRAPEKLPDLDAPATYADGYRAGLEAAVEFIAARSSLDGEYYGPKIRALPVKEIRALPVKEAPDA